MTATVHQPDLEARAAEPYVEVWVWVRLIALQALTSTGQWAALVAAQTYAVFSLHQGAQFLTLLSACAAAPLLANRRWGRISDRHGPRHLGLAAAAGSAAACAAAALAVHGVVTLAVMLAVVSVCRGALQASADTAPTWTENVGTHTRASIWISLAQAAPLIIGPSLAAWLTVTWGIGAAFTATAVLCAAAGVLLASLPLRRPATEQTTNRSIPPVGELRRILLVLTLTVASYAVIEGLEPVYLRQVVHAPASMLAVNDATFGLTCTMAGFALVRVQYVLQHRATLPLAVLAVASTEVMLTASHTAAITTTASGLWGIAVAVLAPATRVRLLAAVPARRHGAVLGSVRTLWATASLGSALVIGPYAAAAGVQVAIATCAGLLALSSVAVRPRRTTPPTVSPIPAPRSTAL